MDTGILLAIRAETARMLRALREQHTPIDNLVFQSTLCMQGHFKALAPFLPPRHCCACGLPAADAEEWGHKVEGPLCQDHPSAWT